MPQEVYSGEMPRITYFDHLTIPIGEEVMLKDNFPRSGEVIGISKKRLKKVCIIKAWSTQGPLLWGGCSIFVSKDNHQNSVLEDNHVLDRYENLSQSHQCCQRP